MRESQVCFMIQIQKYNLHLQVIKQSQMDVNEIFFIGHNKYGQAGTGQQQHNKKYLQPKDIVFRTFIKQVSCGNHHSALLTIDGLIYTMGSNIHGTLGLGNSGNINYAFKPTLVKELRDVDQVVSGSYHMCAIRQGELYTWGKGIDGQLGHGNMKNVFVPTRVQTLGSEVQGVSCGLNHTLVIVNSQTSQMNGYAFGSGIYGQLGCGSNRSFNHPVSIKLSHIQSISAGQNHSLFISQGRLYGCGDNTSYQLGQLDDTTYRNKKYVLQPVKLQAVCSEEVSLIDCYNLSMAMTEKGKVVVWGGRGRVWPPVVVGEQEVVNFKVANQKVYCVNSKSELISLTFTPSTPRLPQKQLLLSTKTVMDMDCGQNHLLVVGDIIAQIQQKTQSSTLSLWTGQSLSTSKKSFTQKHSMKSQSTVKVQNLTKIPINQQMPEFYFTMHLKSGLSEDERSQQLQGGHSISQYTQQQAESLSRNPSCSQTFKTFQNISSSVEMQSHSHPIQINDNSGKHSPTQHQQLMIKNRNKPTDIIIQPKPFNAENTIPETMQFNQMRLQKLMEEMEQKTIHLKRNYPMNANGSGYVPKYIKSITKTPSSYIKKEPENFVMGSEQVGGELNYEYRDDYQPRISQFDDRVNVGLVLQQQTAMQQNQTKLPPPNHLKDAIKKNLSKRSLYDEKNKQNEVGGDESNKDIRKSQVHGKNDTRQDDQSIESIFMELLRKQKERVPEQNIFQNVRANNQDRAQLPQRRKRLSHSCISPKLPPPSSSTSRIKNYPPQPAIQPCTRSPIHQNKLTMSKISQHSNISARTNFKKNTQLLQISRSNRELRFELRDRNLKISQLQQELSKKEIEMQMMYQQLEYFRNATITCQQCGNQSHYQDPFSSN